ncbi:MAG TPA: thymidine phosphorylase, partial [Citreicella sp.]|nr:thymidine phosphorylase [Citreicella sp.]
AAERMARMVAGLGGPADLLEQAARHLPQAPVRREVPAPEAGHVAAMDGEALGLAVVRLGGGRLQKEDRIDPAVGLAGMVRLGQKLDRGAPLAVVHAATPEAAERAVREVQAAVTLGPAPEPLPLVLERIG